LQSNDENFSMVAEGDRKLPALKLALNSEAMQTRLAQALPTLFGDAQEEAAFLSSERSRTVRVQHRVLKYKPGKHCVIEYFLESDGRPARWPRVIGKIYRDERGRRMFENLQNLWLAARTSATPFGMPQPLGYLTELGMVIQEAMPGQPLRNMLEDENLAGVIRLVARNLSVLHRLPLASLEKSGMRDHLKKYCHPGPELLMEAYPQLAAQVEAILAKLLDETRRNHFLLSPVHGDLGLDQILLAGDQVYFIDFDGLCLAHPALDLGNFLVALRFYLGARGEKFAEIFLARYLEEQGAERVEGLAVYQAFACLRRVMICFRKSGGKDVHETVKPLLDASCEYLGLRSL
jgi:aminoglycoside phosphotransferase